jgi:hypothetical protein
MNRKLRFTAPSTPSLHWCARNETFQFAKVFLHHNRQITMPPPVCRRTPNHFSRSLAPPLESASQTLPAAKPTEKNIPRWIWCVSCGPGESRIQLFFSRPKSEDNEEIKNTCGYNLHANLCPHRTGSNEIQPLLCTTLQAANHINQKWRPGKRLKVKKNVCTHMHVAVSAASTAARQHSAISSPKLLTLTGALANVCARLGGHCLLGGRFSCGSKLHGQTVSRNWSKI